MSQDPAALLPLMLSGGALAPRRTLLETHGTPARALAIGPRGWREAGLDARQIASLQAPEAAALQRARDWLALPGHHLLGWHDPDYPALLRRCASPPLGLFVDGDPAALWRPLVAIVGSRSSTATGRDHAAWFSRSFAAAGLAVASGLASGIDAAAHEACLATPQGCTIAVVGTGLDLTYPAHHRDLHARMAARGAVVSEFPPGTPAQVSHFPSRNRILAALSLATLVVEAGEKSGALITARQAAEAGRDVFALPGSIRHPLARGCHRLIREGAGLVEHPDEVIAALAGPARDLGHLLRARLHEAESEHGPAASTPPPHLQPDYQSLWLALGPDPTPMDSLVERTGLTVASLSSMLLGMELDGCISVEHGRYTRTS